MNTKVVKGHFKSPIFPMELSDAVGTRSRIAPAIALSIVFFVSTFATKNIPNAHAAQKIFDKTDM